jgi:hypothetical protein
MSPVKFAPAKSSSAPSLSLGGGGLEAADPSVKALAELEYTVNTSARRYNELKVAADKKSEQLKQLQVRRLLAVASACCCVCLLLRLLAAAAAAAAATTTTAAAAAAVAVFHLLRAVFICCGVCEDAGAFAGAFCFCIW